jgi:Leucine-rich repeat (LRR) protein
VSLTLHRTKVADLSPLAKSGLQRLHIGETRVTDLSPLAGLRLTRLVFDPEKITKGKEAVMAIPTITEIGTKFEDEANDLAAPAVFWQSHR